MLPVQFQISLNHEQELKVLLKMLMLLIILEVFDILNQVDLCNSYGSWQMVQKTGKNMAFYVRAFLWIYFFTVT